MDEAELEKRDPKIGELERHIAERDQPVKDSEGQCRTLRALRRINATDTPTCR